MLIDSLSFTWHTESFPLWYSSQNIAHCKNVAGASGVWGFFTFSEIILLDFEKNSLLQHMHFRLTCGLLKVKKNAVLKSIIFPFYGWAPGFKTSV